MTSEEPNDLRDSIVDSIWISSRCYVCSRVDIYVDNLTWTSTDIDSVYNPAYQQVGTSVRRATKESIGRHITKQLKEYDFRRTNQQDL